MSLRRQHASVTRSGPQGNHQVSWGLCSGGSPTKGAHEALSLDEEARRADCASSSRRFNIRAWRSERPNIRTRRQLRIFSSRMSDVNIQLRSELLQEMRLELARRTVRRPDHELISQQVKDKDVSFGWLLVVASGFWKLCRWLGGSPFG